MPDCLFAFTPANGLYPEYISVNLRNGEVEITVRAPRHGDHCGDTAAMTLPREHVKILAQELLRHVERTVPTDRA